MAHATLISYTGIGHTDKLYAARLLAYTKNTRMNMNPIGLEKFMEKTEEEIYSELAYMSTSIASSWEFADVTFLIQDISRNTAQQMTRSRNAVFAMQSQRVTDLSDVKFDLSGREFNDAMNDAIERYSKLVESGIPLEEARDVLPGGVHCNLVAKYNFRSFVDLVKSRESLRVQKQYRQIISDMKAEVIFTWPWSKPFFESKHDRAISMIEEVAVELSENLNERGAMYKGLSGKLAKAADLLKKE